MILVMPSSVVWSQIQTITGYVANDPFIAYGPSSTDLVIEDGDLLVFFFTGNNAAGNLGTIGFSGSFWSTPQSFSSSPIVGAFRYLNNNDWNAYDGGPGVGALPYTFTSTVNIGRLLIGAAVVRGEVRNFYGTGMGTSGASEPLDAQEALPWVLDTVVYGNPTTSSPFVAIDTAGASLSPNIADADGGVILGALSISIDSGSTVMAFSNYGGIEELTRSEQAGVGLLLFGQAYSAAATADITSDITEADNVGIQAFPATSFVCQDVNTINVRMRAFDTTLERDVYWLAPDIDADGTNYTGPGPLLHIVVVDPFVRPETPTPPPPDPVDPGDVVDASVLWLRTSPDIVYLPPISTNHAIIMEGDFADSAAMFAAYPNADDYLFVVTGGGNFVSWGNITVNGMAGSSGRYRTLRFFNVADDWMHPYARIGGNEVLVDAIRFVNSSYWIASGFTQRNVSGQNDILTNSHHCVFGRFLVQGQTNNYAFQSRAGDGCIVQQCAILDPAEGSGLIGISPDPNSGPQSGFKSLDNEVRNYVDGMLVGRHPTLPFTNIDVLSEGNDYYADGTRYLPGTQFAEIENGIDIKGSSDAVQSVSRRDRIWGMRQYTGHAAGDAVEIHRQARNWLFDQLFVDNCRQGFFETGWDSPTDPETPRDIVITDSQFANVKAYTAGDGAGAIFRVINNFDVSTSWFVNSDGIVYVPTTMRAGGPVFNDNTATNTPTYVSGTLASPYVEIDNSIGDPDASRQYVQVQRWTGGGTTFRLGAKITVTQLNREPVCAITIALDEGDVDVTETHTLYGGATITSRSCDWGDGTSPDTGPNPSHTYASNGIYTITFDITDSNGLTSKTQRNVWVTALPAPQKPRFQSMGTLLKTTAGGTPGAPAGCQPDDLLICFGLSIGTEPTSFSAANGFTLVDGTAFGEGDSPWDSGLVAGGCLLLALKRVGSGETSADWAPTFNDPGNHLMAGVLRYDRVFDSVSVLDVIDDLTVSIQNTASTSVEIPGGASTEPNDLVIGFATTGLDSDTGDFSSVATAAPHLANSTIRLNEGTSQGNGSGMLIVEGDRALAGAYGGWTATLGTIFRQVRVSIAIKGRVL